MNEEQNASGNVGKGILKNKKIVIAVVVIIAIIIVGGAINTFVGRKTGEKLAENILEKSFGGDVDVDSDGKSFSVDTKDGSLSVGENVKWPSSIPSDIPEFKAGKLAMAGSSITGGTGWQVLANNVSKSDYEAYHLELKSKGWVDVGVMDVGVGIVQMKKGTMDLILTFNPEENAISLVVAENQE